MEPTELSEVSGNSEVFRIFQGLLPQRPSQEKMLEWKVKWV